MSDAPVSGHARVADLIEAVVSGAFATRAADTEGAWHALWREHQLDTARPAAAAFLGGALSDRLSWVFVSGYQAALRAVFPALPPAGWAAFVASEPDAAKGSPGSPTSVADSRPGWKRLDGTKSWVAQSRHVAHLLVTAKEGDATSVWQVPANAEGVRMTHREAPGFLPSLSQGSAVFDAVAVPGSARHAAPLRQRFARMEGRFVMLSAVAFMLAHWCAGPWSDRDESACAGLVTLALALIDLNEHEWVPPLLGGYLDTHYSAQVQYFEAHGPAQQIPEWRESQALLTMYSRRMQTRAARYRPDSSPGTP